MFINEQVKSNEYISIGEEKLRRIISEAQIILFEFNNNGIVTFIDGKELEVLGIDRNEVTGTSIFDVYAKFPSVVEEFKKALNGEKIRSITELNGLFFETVCTPVRNNNGRVESVTGVSTNITEIVRSDFEIQLNASRLELLHHLSILARAGASIQQVAQYAVKNLYHRYPYARVSYSTMDNDEVLTMENSISPEGMSDLQDRQMNLATIPQYLEDLKTLPYLAIPDIESYYNSKFSEMMTAIGTKAKLDMPIVFSTNVVSLLCLDSPVPKEWTDDEIHTLRQVANILKGSWEQIKRKDAENALLASEERFRLMMKQSPISITLFDVSGNLVQFNEAWRKLWDLPTTEEVIGRFNILEDKQALENGYVDAFKNALHGEFVEIKEAVYGPEISNFHARRRILHSLIYPLKDELGQIKNIAVIHEDITKRKEHEQQQQLSIRVIKRLNEQDEKSNKIYDILNLIKTYTKINTVAIRLEDNYEYRYYATQGYGIEVSADKTHRYPCDVELRKPESNTGSSMLSCLCSKVFRKNFEPFNENFTPGGSFWANNFKKLLDSVPSHRLNEVDFYQCRLREYKSVAVVPLTSGEKIIGLFILKDKRKDKFKPDLVKFFEGLGASVGTIMERQQAQEALKESEEKHRILFETMVEGVLYQDINSKIISANPAAAKILGLSLKQLHSKTLFDTDWNAIYEDGAEFPQEKYPAHLALKIGKPVKNVVMGVFNPKKEKYMWLNMNAIPQFKTGENRPFSVYTTFSDITDRREALQELKNIMQRLEGSNKELEQFAYVASHDLQEPLRKIQAFGDRLKKKYECQLEEQGVDYLVRMINASSRAQTLINDLLTFSRITTRAKPFTTIDLNHLIADVLSDLEILIQKTQGRVIVEKLPKVEADTTQMRQLFQNLINNGLKFHKENVPPVVNISSETGPNDCTIWVRDNGIGFEEKYLDRIFTIFQRLHSRFEYEGTGIGLAVCKKIIERHQGNITAESEPGNGTMFIVTIPLKQNLTN